MARYEVRNGPVTAALAASIMLLAASPAFAQDANPYTGTYFSIGGGYTVQDKSTLSNFVDMRLSSVRAVPAES